MDLKEFYRGKRVLVTGHTGFKGAWLIRILTGWGADVTGYSLEPQEGPGVFRILKLEETVDHVCGDVRDLEHMKRVFDRVRPEVVFHLAAQPIVRESYRDPVYTYETNVMGTVHVLECVRLSPSVRSFVNVTTDKVYDNREWEYGYRETDRLDGYDPYSNSKSCSELVTHSYVRSFFGGDGAEKTGALAAEGAALPGSRTENAGGEGKRLAAVSTCRAGNVIGGGDFAADRIIPDCVRAASEGRTIAVRNPYSTRPFQHVLEPLSVYLTVAMAQAENGSLAGNYNVGPDDCDCINTGRLATLFCEAWGDGASWTNQSQEGPHEASFLKLDCSRVKHVFGWQPRFTVKEAVEQTVAWYKAWLAGEDMRDVTDRQIAEFFAL